MELRINTDVLKYAGLTIDEYFLLYLYYNKLNLKDYSSIVISTGSLLLSLESKGFVKFADDCGDYILTKKSLILFESSVGNKFEEFWSIYPIKVPNGKGGYRAIKTKDIDSKQALECKKKYINLIKKPGEHEKIIKGLNIYLKSLRPTLQYCVGVEVFLNQQLWEKYLDLDDIVEKVEKTEGI